MDEIVPFADRQYIARPAKVKKIAVLRKT